MTSCSVSPLFCYQSSSIFPWHFVIQDMFSLLQVLCCSPNAKSWHYEHYWGLHSFFFLPVMVHYCSAYFRVKSQHEYAPNTAGCFHRSSCLIISTCAVFSATFILKMRKLSIRIFFFESYDHGHTDISSVTFSVTHPSDKLISANDVHQRTSIPLLVCTVLTYYFKILCPDFFLTKRGRNSAQIRR